MADKYQEMTKQFEGFRSTPYLDTRGIPTIGYGFNMNSGSYPDYMTRAQADEVFNTLYGKARNRAQTYIGQPQFEALSPIRQAILTDMAYNLGNKLNAFVKMRNAILLGDDNKVKQEMKGSKWYGQVGNRGRENVKNW
jgi:GH24 family phage-related lysozyme (muramidase)